MRLELPIKPRGSCFLCSNAQEVGTRITNKAIQVATVTVAAIRVVAVTVAVCAMTVTVVAISVVTISMVTVAGFE